MDPSGRPLLSFAHVNHNCTCTILRGYCRCSCDDCWGDCREPALAAYEAEEVLQRGSLAFVGNLATAVANGVFGVAKAAAWGREAGFRAGSPAHTPTFHILVSCCHC